MSGPCGLYAGQSSRWRKGSEILWSLVRNWSPSHKAIPSYLAYLAYGLTSHEVFFHFKESLVYDLRRDNVDRFCFISTHKSCLINVYEFIIYGWMGIVNRLSLWRFCHHLDKRAKDYYDILFSLQPGTFIVDYLATRLNELPLLRFRYWMV